MPKQLWAAILFMIIIGCGQRPTNFEFSGASSDLQVKCPSLRVEDQNRAERQELAAMITLSVYLPKGRPVKGMLGDFPDMSAYFSEQKVKEFAAYRQQLIEELSLLPKSYLEVLRYYSIFFWFNRSYQSGLIHYAPGGGVGDIIARQRAAGWKLTGTSADGRSLDDIVAVTLEHGIILGDQDLTDNSRSRIIHEAIHFLDIRKQHFVGNDAWDKFDPMFSDVYSLEQPRRGTEPAAKNGSQTLTNTVRKSVISSGDREVMDSFYQEHKAAPSLQEWRAMSFDEIRNATRLLSVGEYVAVGLEDAICLGTTNNTLKQQNPTILKLWQAVNVDSGG